MKRKLLLVFLFALVMLSLCMVSFASNDAMLEIEQSLADKYRIGDVVKTDDGYIGIDVEYSVYFDRASTVKNGYHGTPVILYVVNTSTDRTGTESDTKIISSMLERGYVVVVLDYKNSPKAKTPDLDWSIQGLKMRLNSGEIFSDDIFPKGEYSDTYVVPAGYDISINNVFFEIDKHAADGTFEDILNNWNTDLRVARAGTLVKWVHEDGARKTVATASDGSSPVWYDAKGKEDANGEYTKIKWTVAEAFTDCVNPDGTPLDLDLYMTLIYPTSPKSDVPVMALASSSEYLAEATSVADRPQLVGFSLSGYATAVYDYMYVPMARADSYDYYDGGSAMTGDSTSYSLQRYSAYELNTAAIRYIRYLSLSNHGAFAFNNDKIGVYGNSKGASMRFLGEEVLRSPLALSKDAYANEELWYEAISSAITAISDRSVYAGHAGESRYENGITESYSKDGYVIEGGERQPWLAWGGEEIVSGVQFVYASNGGNQYSISDGHSPSVYVCYMQESNNSAYGSSSIEVSLAKNHNVPSLNFEVPLGHTMSYGYDLRYGVDTYTAIFDFIGYYLKDDAAKLLWLTPLDRSVGVGIGDKITLKFTGSVSAEEISRVVISTDGSVAQGSWSSEYGNTEWTFTPLESLLGNARYTITVPAAMKGENGKALGNTYTSTFTTEKDVFTEAEITVDSALGRFVTLDIPTLLEEMNRYDFRFIVSNDAANVAELYEVISFDQTSVENAVVGDLIGSVNLRGKGAYEIEVTDLAAKNQGKSVTLLLKAKNTVGEYLVGKKTFEANKNGIGKDSSVSHALTTSPDGTAALCATVGTNAGKYPLREYYNEGQKALAYSSLIKTSEITPDDLGRKFTVRIEVYDTISRTIQFRLSALTSSDAKTIDYDRVIKSATTTAGEWTTYEIEYVVYDADYGSIGEEKKVLSVYVGNDGANESPIYFGDISAFETVSNIDVSSVGIAMKNDGGIDYKPSESDNAFSVYNGDELVGEHATFSDALSAYKNGYTVKMNSDYTLGAVDESVKTSAVSSFVFDLNGYTLKAFSGKPLVTVNSGVSEKTIINIFGGEVILKSASLVEIAGGGACEISLSELRLATEKSATVSSLLVLDVTAGESASVELILDSCEISALDKYIPKVPFEIFSAAKSASVAVSYAVNGGSIEISSRERVILAGLNAVTFGKNEKGEYTRFVMPENVVPEQLSFIRENDCATLELGYTDGGYSTYVLVGNALSTKYGTIPDEYSDVEKYPFAVFDSDGVFVMATDNFQGINGDSGVVNNASSNKKNWFAVLRAPEFIYDEAVYPNLALIKGSMTVDLQGNKITLAEASGNRMLNALAKSDGTATVSFVNGSIALGNNPIVRITTSSSYSGESLKTFNFNFTDIAFTFTGSAKSMILAQNVNAKLYTNIVFNDCSFDLSGATDGLTLFDIAGGSSNLYANVKVNGGEIISDTLENVKFSNLNANSSMIFGKGKDLTLTTLALDEGESAPTQTFICEDGVKACFGAAFTEGGKTTFVLKEVKTELTTPYGVIPEKYANISEHPFVIFDENGACVGSAKVFGSSNESGFIQMLRNYTSGVYYVYMRCDFTFSGACYDNLTNLTSEMILDLGGHTLTNNASSEKGILFAHTKSSTNVKITVRNGNLVTGARPVVNHDANSGKTGSFSFKFESLNIMLGSAPFVACKDPDAISKSSIVFTDCVIDLTGAAKAFIDLAKTGGASEVSSTIVFEGGRIISGDFSKLDLYANLSGTSSVTFAKGDGSKYTELLLPRDVSVTTESFSTNDGELVFIKCAESNDGYVYTLGSRYVSGVSFIPKVSVTLDRAIVLNIYVPVSDVLTSFKVDGVSYVDFSKLEKVTVDGVCYYAVRIKNPATSALETVNLKAIVEAGESVATVSFSFSVQKYAKLVLENEAAADVEKTLVRDILAYLKHAYDYISLEYPAEIDALIGEETEPKIEGEVLDTYEGLAKATFVLDYAPTIRFYIESGYDTSDFAFYIGGKSVTTTKGRDDLGEYVDISVYAYLTCETVTYTINGKEMGRYHIRSYYEFSTTESEKLEALVLSFWKYCQSARDYRESVVGKDTPVFSGMQSVLLLGQSNMAGRGDINTVDTITDDRIYMMRALQWVKMQEPIHDDKSSAGVGLAASFAKAFVESYGCDVGLIPGAFGGTSLADWSIGGTYYERALEMAKAAQESSEICAILWHQGESDVNNKNYAAELQAILDSFIEELGLDRDKIVIITGELGEFRTSSRDNVHNGLKALASVYKNYGIASSVGLTAQDVTTHFDAASLRVFGYRYFEIFHKITTGEDFAFDNDPDSYRKVVEMKPDADSILADFDFNSMTEGALKNTSTIKGYPKTNGSIDVVSLSDTEKYLVLQNAYDSSTKKYTDTYVDIYNTAATGKITVEFKVRLGDGHGSPIDVKIMGSKTVKVLRVNAKGRLVGYTADGSEVSLGDYVESLEWVSVKIELDFEANKKNVYVNNVLVQADADILEAANSAYSLERVRLQFTDGGTSEGNIQLDDYLCYKRND